jgi:uncharacterized protein (TIGR02246 family)
MLLLSAGLGLALSLAACDRPAETGNGATATKASAADTDAVKATETAFLAALESKDVAAVKTNYAPDAVMVLPDMAPMKGVAAISADYDKFAADPVAKFDATNESTVVGADMAYSQGTYTVTYTNPETKVVENGQGYYLVVYRKQADGSWKIVQDVSSPLPKAS